jgi:hypothetical protein
MVQLSSLLASLAILHFTATAPTLVPLGSTGRSLSISKDGTMASLDGRSIDLRQAFKRSASCQPGMAPGGGANGNAKAIYFISNAANNSVVALKVGADGTLSDGSITATGGAGMSGVDATGAPAGADGLFSQGSVKIAGHVRIFHPSSLRSQLTYRRSFSPSTQAPTLCQCFPSIPLTPPSSP